MEDENKDSTNRCIVLEHAKRDKHKAWLAHIYVQNIPDFEASKSNVVLFVQRCTVAIHIVQVELEFWVLLILLDDQLSGKHRVLQKHARETGFPKHSWSVKFVCKPYSFAKQARSEERKVKQNKTASNDS